MLDVGAGTGRVTLELAARGVEVVAVDVEASLLRELARRAAGLPVTTVACDARELALGRRFALVLAPMQTLQLLGGADGRAAFLRGALEHLVPGGLLAAALADPVDCFDEEHPLPPPPQTCEIDGVRYASRLLAVTDEGHRAGLRRRRTTRARDGRRTAHDVVVWLDRVTADEVASEAIGLGYRRGRDLAIAESEQYLGSTVVLLRAP